MAGDETCDYSKLTATETTALAAAERKRNYTACLSDSGYCDPSRLSADETLLVQRKGEGPK